MELCLLQAKRFDLIVHNYLKVKMFKEAIEISKKYCPNMLKEINNYVQSNQNSNNLD